MPKFSFKPAEAKETTTDPMNEPEESFNAETFNAALSALLGSRKTVTELMQGGILKPTADLPQNMEACKNLNEIGLTEFLKKRPGYLELLRKRLIQDTMTWTEVSIQGVDDYEWEARNLHTTTVIGDNIYIIGGFGVPKVNNPILVLNHKTMEIHRPYVCGMIPLSLGRFGHSTVASGSTLFVFGGMTPTGNYLNDLWACSTELKTESNQQLLKWVLINYEGEAPSARSNHTSVMVGKKMYVFGGRDHSNVFDGLYCFDRDEMKWNRLITQPGLTPVARAGHSMVLVEDKLVVFGGYGQDHVPRNDVAVFDLKGQSWKIFEFHGTPPRSRTGHSAAVIHKTKMLIFGGGYWDKVHNDLHVLDFSTQSWSRPSDTGNIPVPRAGTSVATIGNKLLFYGGGDQNQNFQDIYILDTMFFDTTLAAQLPTPRSSGKVKKRKKKTSSRSPDRSRSPQTYRNAKMREAMEAESLRMSFESLAQSVNASCTALCNSISMTMMKNTSDSQLYQQQFLSMINAVSVAHETELCRLNEEIKMFKDGILSHLQILQNQVKSFTNKAKTPTFTTTPYKPRQESVVQQVQSKPLSSSAKLTAQHAHQGKTEVSTIQVNKTSSTAGKLEAQQRDGKKVNFSSTPIATSKQKQVIKTPLLEEKAACQLEKENEAGYRSLSEPKNKHLSKTSSSAIHPVAQEHEESSSTLNFPKRKPERGIPSSGRKSTVFKAEDNGMNRTPPPVTQGKQVHRVKSSKCQSSAPGGWKNKMGYGQSKQKPLYRISPFARQSNFQVKKNYVESYPPLVMSPRNNVNPSSVRLSPALKNTKNKIDYPPSALSKRTQLNMIRRSRPEILTSDKQEKKEDWLPQTVPSHKQLNNIPSSMLEPVVQEEMEKLVEYRSLPSSTRKQLGKIPSMRKHQAAKEQYQKKVDLRSLPVTKRWHTTRIPSFAEKESLQGKEENSADYPPMAFFMRKPNNPVINIPSAQKKKSRRKRRRGRSWNRESGKQLWFGLAKLNKAEEQSGCQAQESAPVTNDTSILANNIMSTNKAKTATLKKTAPSALDADIINSGKIGWGELDVQTFAMIKLPEVCTGNLLQDPTTAELGKNPRHSH